MLKRLQALFTDCYVHTVKSVKSLSLIVLLLLLNDCISAAELPIVDLLSEFSPPGFGSAIIQTDAVGVLHGDMLSKVVLFEFDGSPSMDRTHIQYIAAFDTYKDETQLIAKPTAIGARGNQQFSELTIETGYVILNGLAWVSGDNACCPSQAITFRFAFVNGVLIPSAK